MRIVRVTDAEGNTIYEPGAQQQTLPNRSSRESHEENHAAMVKKVEQLRRSLEQLQQEKKKQYDELTARQQETRALLLTEQTRNAELTARLKETAEQAARAEKERTVLSKKLEQAEKGSAAAQQDIGELKEQLRNARQLTADLNQQLNATQQQNAELNQQLDAAQQQNAELNQQLDAARNAEQKQRERLQQWTRALEGMKTLPDDEFMQEIDEQLRRYCTLKQEFGTAEEDLVKDSEQLRQMLTSEFADKDQLTRAEEELQQLKDTMETLQKKLCRLSSDAAHSGDERTKALYQEESTRR